MLRFSRFIVLSLMATVLLLHVFPSSCDRTASRSSEVVASSSPNDNQEKKNKKNKNRYDAAPIPAPTSSGEPTKSHLRSNSPSTGPPTVNLVTPTEASSRSNATVTPSPSPKNTTLQEEVVSPTVAPVGSPSSDSPPPTTKKVIPTTPVPTPTVSSSVPLPLPTQDQAQQIIRDPTAPKTGNAGRPTKVVIMMASLAAVLGTMLALGIWHQKKGNRRSLGGASNSPLV